MRPSLPAVATIAIGAIVLAIAIPAQTAAAATSTSCPSSGSTKLFTGSVLNGPENRLWVYPATPTQTIVCFNFYVPGVSNFGGGAIVVNTGVSLTQPDVTVGTDPAACTTEVIRITDPAQLRIALGTSGTTVCFTVNSSTTTVTFGLASVSGVPSVEVWRDGSFGWLDVAACPVEYAEYLAGSGVRDCLTTPGRIV